MRKGVASSIFGRKDHGYCRWCKRPLVASNSRDGRAFTFDHVQAASRSGRRRVPCCRQCNFLKADMPVADWCWMIDTVPRYWRVFQSPVDVRIFCMRERSRRVRAGEPPLSQELYGSYAARMRDFGGGAHG